MIKLKKLILEYGEPMYNPRFGSSSAPKSYKFDSSKLKKGAVLKAKRNGQRIVKRGDEIKIVDIQYSKLGDTYLVHLNGHGNVNNGEPF